jgi:hypothetical protein
MSKKEKLKVMKARQNALSFAALALLKDVGYVIGASLKIPGAFGFHATRNGKPTKIGIKTSADRWVGVPRNKTGSWGLLDACDELFVVTFNDRYDPKQLQVIAFDPKKVIAMGKKVYAKAEKENQTGLQWIPLDNHLNNETTAMAAGPLGPHGTVIFDEQITWISGDNPEAGGLSATASSTPLHLTIPQAKAALALTFGVSPDAIKITVEG